MGGSNLVECVDELSMLNVVNLAAVTVFARVISRVFFLRCRC